MDNDEELALLIAKKRGGISEEQVKAELKEVEKRARLGKPRGVAEISTLVGLLVQLVRLAREIWPNKTTKERGAELEENAALATKIDKKEREIIINLILESK